MNEINGFIEGYHNQQFTTFQLVHFLTIQYFLQFFWQMTGKYFCLQNLKKKSSRIQEEINKKLGFIFDNHPPFELYMHHQQYFL